MKDEPPKRKRRKGLKANYGDATPEDVARALLLYRPKRKQPTTKADEKPKPATD